MLLIKYQGFDPVKSGSTGAFCTLRSQVSIHAIAIKKKARLSLPRELVEFEVNILAQVFDSL